MHRPPLSLTFLPIAAALLGCDVGLSELTPAPLEKRYATPPSKFVTLPSGARVHYRIEGDPTKPTLLLLHGATDSLFAWDAWVEALADRYRLVRLDLAGHGLTGPVPNERYSPADQAAMLDEFVEVLGLGRISVAGNSFGGATAWTWAALSPERVDKVILLDSGGYPSDEIPLRFARTPILGKLLIEDLTPSKWLLKRQYDQLAVDDARATPAFVDRFQDLIRREGNRRATWLRQNDERPSPVQPRDIERPTLILWGDQDPWFDASYGRRFQAEIEGSILCALPNSGHMPMYDEPRETADIVDEFLSGRSLTGCGSVSGVS